VIANASQKCYQRFSCRLCGRFCGGLDAYVYIRLLRHLPADMGVAIVIVNHLRTVATLLHEILPRYPEMPVELLTEKLLIQANRVFVIPEHRDLHVLDGEFRLEPTSKPRGWLDVITVFLRSLTQHWDGKLIAVIVSGYDGDRAAALCGIKEVGRITIAQKLDTASQPDMPESAIAKGGYRLRSFTRRYRTRDCSNCLRCVVSSLMHARAGRHAKYSTFAASAFYRIQLTRAKLRTLTRDEARQLAPLGLSAASSP
jgi:two-component system chemotaxis response regulator CheB